MADPQKPSFTPELLVLGIAAVQDFGRGAIAIAFPAVAHLTPGEAYLRVATALCAVLAAAGLARRRRWAVPALGGWAALWVVGLGLVARSVAGAVVAVGGARGVVVALVLVGGVLLPVWIVRDVWRRRTALA